MKVAVPTFFYFEKWEGRGKGYVTHKSYQRIVVCDKMNSDDPIERQNGPIVMQTFTF